MKKEQFRVTGITCASCAAIIERTLGKIEEIDSIAVNVATEMATMVIPVNASAINRATIIGFNLFLIEVNAYVLIILHHL